MILSRLGLILLQGFDVYTKLFETRHKTNGKNLAKFRYPLYPAVSTAEKLKYFEFLRPFLVFKRGTWLHLRPLFEAVFETSLQDVTGWRHL
jgi:hypothetical protein